MMCHLNLSLFISLFSLLVVTNVTSNNPWCDEEHSCLDQWSGQRIKHTMCEYEHIPPECGTDRGWQHGWEDGEREVVLDLHNQLRARVARGEVGNQPPAANMMWLEWDEEAEIIAQHWANQCRSRGHDECNSNWEGEDMGQNYAWRGGAGSYRTAPPRLPMIEESITDLVVKEVGNMRRGFVSRFPQNSLMYNIGHYTQVVWAETARLGCGIAYLTNKNGYMLNWEYKLICNYMVRGNMEGSPIYIEGKAASQCPHGAVPSQKYKGLCEYSRKYKDTIERVDERKKFPTQSQSATDPLKKPELSKPVEEPKLGVVKPIAKQSTGFNNKPTQQSTPGSTFNIDFSNLPLIGRLFRRKPTEYLPRNRRVNNTPSSTQNNKSQLTYKPSEYAKKTPNMEGPYDKTVIPVGLVNRGDKTQFDDFHRGTFEGANDFHRRAFEEANDFHRRLQGMHMSPLAHGFSSMLLPPNMFETIPRGFQDVNEYQGNRGSYQIYRSFDGKSRR